MADGRSTRWTGHRERRRTEFVNAAVRAVERFGPSATLEQIAAEAGTSKQVLYRHFADRRDLTGAVAEHVATRLVDHLTPRLAVDEGAEAGIRHAVTSYLDFIDANLELFRFVRAQDDESAPAAVRRVKETITDAITAVARSAADGTGSRFSDLTAIALVGMADAVITAWLDEPHDLTRGQLVDELVAMALGLLTGATSARRASAG